MEKKIKKSKYIPLKIILLQIKIKKDSNMFEMKRIYFLLSGKNNY